MDDEPGDVLRSVPLDKETRTEFEGLLAKQREWFIAKFDREPSLRCLLSFDMGEDATSAT